LNARQASARRLAQSSTVVRYAKLETLSGLAGPPLSSSWMKIRAKGCAFHAECMNVGKVF
jgi:hypothetical protein